MTRIKRGIMVKKRHKKLLKEAKGNWGQRKNIFKRARETLLRAWAFAFRSRKLLKRDMRALFISRIKAAARSHGLSYNFFIHGLKKANVNLNRKMLSQLAVMDPESFAALTVVAQG